MTLETIQPLLDWIANHPELSGLIVFLIAFGESLALVGIIVPGVVFMLSIGTLVGLGAINLWSALIWAAFGAIAGDWFSYWLGRHFDQQLRHVWPLSRYPKLIPAGEKFFTRHGGKSVLFGRFVGPLRPIIPAIAGIMHMSQAKFYFMNIVSAILWAPVVILPGVAFGNSLQLASEVFGKLIVLIVILILIAALFGYVAKKLFAYALMTTVNTWGELFGFDRARENLTSFSLAGVLILAVALFVGHHEQRYKPVLTAQQASDYQWWQDHWQHFSPVATPPQVSKFRSKFPITIQWWGNYDRIRSELEERGWQSAKSLTLHNSLNYFLPKPDPLKLPVRKTKLFNSEEQLIMLKPTTSDNQLLIIRLWSTKERSMISEDHLWLGVVYRLNIISPFDLFSFPMKFGKYTQTNNELRREFAVDNEILVRKKLYSGVGVSDVWHGDVLLLSFSSTTDTHLPSIRENSTQQIRLRNYPLTQAGRESASLVVPATLTGSLDSGLNYDVNGIAIRVRRIAELKEGKDGFNELKKQIRQQLQNPQNMQLISVNEEAIDSQNMTGSQFTAQYDMQLLGKKSVYRVKLMRRSSQVWLATSIHKQCDTRGGQVAMAMLDSIKLEARN